MYGTMNCAVSTSSFHIIQKVVVKREDPGLMLHFVYHFKQNCVHDLTFNLHCQMCHWVYSKDVAATAGHLLLTPHLMCDKLPWLVMHKSWINEMWPGNRVTFHLLTIFRSVFDG